MFKTIKKAISNIFKKKSMEVQPKAKEQEETKEERATRCLKSLKTNVKNEMEKWNMPQTSFSSILIWSLVRVINIDVDFNEPVTTYNDLVDKIICALKEQYPDKKFNRGLISSSLKKAVTQDANFSNSSFTTIQDLANKSDYKYIVFELYYIFKQYYKSLLNGTVIDVVVSEKNK